MISFLDSFCQALIARDGDLIRRHLRHPLARALPGVVRVEALAIGRAGAIGHLAPTRTLHFYYQTLQLLASSETASPDDVGFEFAPVAQPMSQIFAATA